MVDYTIVNSTKSQLTNVNVGGIDIPAESVRHGVTLTAAELAAVIAAGVAVTVDAATYQDKRNIAYLLKYRKVETGAAL